jgi:hydrogenase nickel incorporation protein HypA/HybF
MVVVLQSPCEDQRLHETTIARDLVALACELIAGDRSRAARINVRLGVWSGVVAEALAGAYPAAAHQTPLEGSKLVIQSVGLVVFCPRCNAERPIPEARRLRCPVCDAHSPRIVRGMELELLSVEMTDDASHP